MSIYQSGQDQCTGSKTHSFPSVNLSHLYRCRCYIKERVTAMRHSHPHTPIRPYFCSHLKQSPTHYFSLWISLKLCMCRITSTYILNHSGHTEIAFRLNKVVDFKQINLLNELLFILSVPSHIVSPDTIEIIFTDLILKLIRVFHRHFH